MNKEAGKVTQGTAARIASPLTSITDTVKFAFRASYFTSNFKAKNAKIGWRSLEISVQQPSDFPEVSLSCDRDGVLLVDKSRHFT